ncbi:SusC/RagA family TonB-linked outer membrane protein [Niabella beijingensis]|uniref:SusC/RagA family TonB-linked outer membrane protein n=1 Tax=Niabella beijingensis TaxID=2872700 RepID=UPI001CC0743D|nr:TonB-dependent receptor [Niabella beijingensis]MBZ4190089.1 TonB-dependent receptor [Niabella beijingensis]
MNNYLIAAFKKSLHPPGKARLLVIALLPFLAAGLCSNNATAATSLSYFQVQQQTITGKVTDKAGAPVAGASIQVKGTNEGTTTNSEGLFELKTGQQQVVLEVSFVGKKTQEVTVTDSKPLEIILEDDATMLSEVVAVAFGNQQRKTITSSITQVNTKVIQDRPVNNIASALQGQVAGVNITQGSGQPGANPSINIRGIGTLQSGTSPLIIIDGIPGTLSMINPNDVESISVLKDASASSLYGARAANGVVLVTTKKGKIGKAVISYSGYMGFQKPTELFKEASAYAYADAYNTALMYDAITSANPDFDASKKVFTQAELNGWKSGAVPSTDWRGALFDKDGFTHSHTINISGGLSNEGISVRNNASFGYLDQDGNIVNTKYQRYTLRDNAEIKWNKFTLALSLGIGYTKAKEPTSARVGNLGAIISAINRQRPVDSIKNSNGDWNITSTNDTRNPVRQAYEGGLQNSQVYNILANVNLGYQIAKGLDLKFTNGINYSDNTKDIFKNSLDWYNGTTSGPNSSLKESYKDVHYLQQLDLTYQKRFGDHSLNAILGGQQEFHTFRYLSGYREGYPNNLSGSLQLGPQTGINNNSIAYEWGIMGLFARVNYDYKKKYLLELNAREDGSSRLTPGSNWDFFPSASAGWRISEEPFMESLKPTLSELKLRASYGVLGNQNLPGDNNDLTLANYNQLYYSYQSLFGPASNSYFGPLYYIFGDQIYNPMMVIQDQNTGFTWERTKMLDVAIEGGLWNGMVNFSLGYFNKVTNAMLMTKKVSSVHGGKDYIANIGKMKNYGYEFELGLNKTTTSGFTIFANGNLTYLTNKILDLGGIDLAPSGNTKNTVGYPLNAYYIYENAGLLTKSEFLDPNYTLITGQKYGDQKIKDQDGNGIINASDKVMLNKSSTPRWLYGLNFDLGYKNFGIAGMLQGAADYYKYLGASVGYGFNSGYSITQWTIDHSYNPMADENNYSTRLPRTSVTNSINSTYPSTIFLFNSSYVRLKNLRVYYNLPGTVLEKLKLNNARFYVSGQNLFTLSKIPRDLGIDPEVSSATAGYPQVKIFTFGVDVSF